MRPSLPILVLLLSTLAVACVPARHRATTQRIDRNVDQLLQGQQITHEALEELLDIARRQGTGDITLFFGPNAKGIPGDTLRHQRLVRFLDHLVLASAGRELLFVCVGSASARGSQEWNDGLSTKRAQAAAEVIDKYLVNQRHRVLRAYGTGESQSPEEASLKEHSRYRSVRVVAVYDEAMIEQLFELPRPR